jgi:hypothetical protein
LLRSASHRLLPRSILPFIPPKPLTVPTCWAPSLIPFSPRTRARRQAPLSHGDASSAPSLASPSDPTVSRSTSSFTAFPSNNDSTREQPADTSPRAFARRDQDRLGMGCAGDSPAQTVLASCASTSESGGIPGMRL